MKKHTMIRAVAVICAIVLMAVGATGCGGKSELDRVRVCEVTHSIFYAPQYAAIALGFFEQEGIEVELSNGNGADAVMAAVLSGNMDIGFAGPEASIYVYNEGKEDHTQVFAQVTQRDGSFLLARDTMHQNQWTTAALELQAEGAEQLPVPSNFPLNKEYREVSYQYLNFSDGQSASEGSWASGPTPDGLGEFTYHEGPTTSAPMPPPTRVDARYYGTTDLPNVVEKAAGAVQDKLKKE